MNKELKPRPRSVPSPTSVNVPHLQALAHEIRRDVFNTIRHAGSGHLGGCSSSVELMTALYFGGHLRFDPKNPDHPDRDKVLIRGHEGPLRYKIFSKLGMLDEQELTTYRSLGSRLQGHEDMELPGVDITPSGSLGMGLSYGVGAAITMKNNGHSGRVFVFLGDGEEQEGNISEAARHATSIRLDNLVCILDQNGKQLSRPTSDSDGSTDVKTIWEGYGWDVIVIEDGHSLEEIQAALSKLTHLKKPTLFIAKTIKGQGLEGADDHFSGYHTVSTCSNDTVAQGISTQQRLLDDSGIEPETISRCVEEAIAKVSLGEPQRKAISPFPVKIEVDPENNRNLDAAQVTYFAELAKLVEPESPDIYVITPDFVRKDLVGIAGFDKFAFYFDVGIREQHAVAMAHGISVTDPRARIILNYGDAFIYRASDQINAAAQGGSKMILLSEFSGLTQGKNGKTHQSSGQPGAIITMPGAFFNEAADVQDLFNILNKSLTENPGVVYVRSHSANVDPLERNSEDRYNSSYYVTHEDSIHPDLVIVASGLVVPSAVEAARIIHLNTGRSVRVINVVDHKSIDGNFLNLLEPDAPVLTAYNGNPRHMQMLVSSAVMEHRGHRPSLIKGTGFRFGTSGSLPDLMRHYGLDAQGIARTGAALI